MSSRRKLKKDLKKAFGELFADCVTLNMCHQADEKKIAELMTQTLSTYSDLVSRISHTEKGRERAFYHKLREEFVIAFNKISEEIIKA